MENAIANISVSLTELNRQEHQFHRYSILVRKNVYSILAGRHASKLRGRGLDFEEVRKYVPGDDIRNIDWNVTARTRTTHTKVFNEEKERPNFTIVDQSSNMFFGSVHYTKSYVAAMLAATAGFKVLKSGDRFGGVIFDEQGSDYVQPRRSRKSLQHFFHHLVDYGGRLAKSEKDVNETNGLNEVLYKISGGITHDHVVVIISDFLQADEQTMRYLTRLSKHNDVICMQVTDPLETSLPDQKILLTDGSRQMLWAKNKKQTQLFSENMENRQSAFQEDLRKYGIPLLSFNTTEDITEQMKNVIRRVLKR